MEASKVGRWGRGGGGGQGGWSERPLGGGWGVRVEGLGHSGEMGGGGGDGGSVGKRNWGGLKGGGE